MSDGLRFPWDSDPPPAPAVNPDPDVTAPRPKPRGRRPAARIPTPASEPNWLYHHLTVSGPGEHVEKFAAAARGSGVIPWQLDYAAIEEDIFVRAVSQPASQRSLSVEGCRILARQFREKVELRQARAMALVGRSVACPFDLYALLPVPGAVLQLGPIHPAALAWLAAHWGITDRLRQVAVRDHATAGRRLPRNQTVIGYSFFTHQETPDAAIAHLVTRWPALRFRLALRPLD